MKATLRSLYKAFVVYRQGFRYIWYRYGIAPKILRYTQPLERPITHPNLSIHMLTCHRDVLISAWSLASFYYFSQAIGRLTIHDDGTLTASDCNLLKRLFPSARIVSVNTFFERHEQGLSEHPTLIDFRKTFKGFQSKKLLDVFFERQGDIILYLDSDMLWFQNPREIEDAVNRGAHDVSFMMSNGPRPIHVTFRDGSKTTDAIAECNSGVTLFNAQNFDLTRLEQYVAQCDYLTKRFTDQACFGSILSHVQILPRKRYFIKGTITADTVMRHYTGPSREKFFFYGLDRLASKILGA